MNLPDWLTDTAATIADRAADRAGVLAAVAVIAALFLIAPRVRARNVRHAIRAIDAGRVLIRRGRAWMIRRDTEEQP